MPIVTMFSWVTLATLASSAGGVLSSLTSIFTRQAYDHLSEFLGQGKLPPNHDLEGTFRRSLCQATTTLAWSLHDPKRPRLRDLLENASDWPKFYIQFWETIQGGIIPRDSKGSWLDELMSAASDQDAFKELSFKLELTEDQINHLSRGEPGDLFAEKLHDEFIAWVGRHVTNNPNKPADFDDYVRKGITVSGTEGRHSFYQLVCCFFREALKADPRVFHALSLQLSHSVADKLDRLDKKLPNADEIQRLTRALEFFQQTDIENIGVRSVATENAKSYQLIQEGFAGMRRRFDQLDQKIDALSEKLGASRGGHQLQYDIRYEEKLFGRDEELAELTRWLVTDGLRQILLWGGPGLGKTHLTCTLLRSEAVKAHFARCVFVDLRNADTVESMCEKIARSLGVPTAANDNTAKLINDWLAGQWGRLLIVLDNLESVAEEGRPVIENWLQNNPSVTILATSRMVYTGLWQKKFIEPLPEVFADWPREEQLRSPALQWFIKQARRANAGFNLDSGDSLALARSLCDQLDYVPLAIEFVANLVANHGLAALAADISQTLRDADSQDKLFLIVGRSLRTVTPAARALFFKLHIFEDGFSAAAAQAVSGTQETAVRPLLLELLNKSLLTGSETGLPGAPGTRYHMFSIVHEYAKNGWEQRDPLALRPAEDRLTADWTSYFFKYIRVWAGQIHGPDGQDALEMLAIEQSNILQALEIVLASDDTLGTDFYLHFAEYLAIRGPAQKRGRLLNLCRAKPPGTPARQLRLLGHFVRHCWATSQYDVARPEILQIFHFAARPSPDPEYAEALARALLEVGYLKLHHEGAKAGKPSVIQSLRLFKQSGSDRGVAEAKRLMSLILEDEARFPSALRLIRDAIDYFERQPGWLELAQCLNSRGVTHWHTGDWESALKDYTRAETIFLKLKNDMRLGGVYTNRALALTDAGRYEESLQCAERATMLHIRGGNPDWQSVNLVAKARAFFYQQKEDADVMRVLEAAQQLSTRYRENNALRMLIEAQSLYARGFPREALALMDKTREEQEKLYPCGNHRVCYSRILMAQLYYDLGRLSPAREEAREAFALAKKFGYDEDIKSLVLRHKFLELIRLERRLKQEPAD